MDGRPGRDRSGRALSAGSYPRIFPVRGPITVATGFAWNNR